MWELLTGEEPYASMHYGAIIGLKLIPLVLQFLFTTDILLFVYIMVYGAVSDLILFRSCSCIAHCVLKCICIRYCVLYAGGIVNNTLRPTIPTWCDPLWKSLMERCWSAEPTFRPSFSEVASELRVMATAPQPKAHG